MDAPECIPLVMEPESRFYSDPVIVLDFQSLYPSMIIAYNYCFSTCLGKVSRLDKYVCVLVFSVSICRSTSQKLWFPRMLTKFSFPRIGDFEFGCTSLNVPPALLEVRCVDILI